MQNLNTSHVKVQHFQTQKLSANLSNLNTSHVKVQQLYKNWLFCGREI